MPSVSHDRSRQEAVLARLDHEAVFGEVLQLRGRGHERSARCIFHDDRNPSMSVNVRTGMFICHNPACGARGDVFALVMRAYGWSFPEALERLERRAGIVRVGDLMRTDWRPERNGRGSRNAEPLRATRGIAERPAVGVALTEHPARFTLLSLDEIRPMPQPPWLVQRIIPVGLVALIGPPGHGKTFWALDLALSVGSGLRMFHGHVAEHGPVVYVLAEGAFSAQLRIAAWEQSRSIAEASGVMFLPEPVQLLDGNEVDAFIGAVTTSGCAPKLVILDTLARCLVSGEENSARDVGLAIAAMDRIRAATGATVLVTHHTRKDEDEERGSTALRGAMDAMIGIRKNGPKLTVSCMKQKEAEEFGRYDVWLAEYAASAAITLTAPMGARESNLGRIERELLQSLSRHFGSNGASATAWQQASGISPSSFFRYRSEVIERGYVRQEVNRYFVTPLGMAALTTNSQVTPNTALEALENTNSQTSSHTPPFRGVGVGSDPDDAHPEW